MHSRTRKTSRIATLSPWYVEALRLLASCKCPVLSEELFAMKSLVHGVILKIFLKVGWRYLANNLTFSHSADSAPYRALNSNLILADLNLAILGKVRQIAKIKFPAVRYI